MEKVNMKGKIAMEDKIVNDKLIEKEYKVNENAPILDCTKEIEQYMEDILPE